MEKPILFNTDMVRAILDGRKTVIRRLVKHDVRVILNSQFHKANMAILVAVDAEKQLHTENKPD